MTDDSRRLPLAAGTACGATAASTTLATAEEFLAGGSPRDGGTVAEIVVDGGRDRRLGSSSRRPLRRRHRRGVIDGWGEAAPGERTTWAASTATWPAGGAAGEATAYGGERPGRPVGGRRRRQRRHRLRPTATWGRSTPTTAPGRDLGEATSAAPSTVIDERGRRSTTDGVIDGVGDTGGDGRPRDGARR